MKDSISIGKLNTKNSSWLIFDENAMEYGPEKLFNEVVQEEFKTLFSFIPTKNTKDVSVHIKKVKEYWESKDINFFKLR